MFGIETIEVLMFFKQVGLALGGACAFWGTVFLFLSRMSQSQRPAALWQGVAQKLLLLFFPGLLLYGISWAIIAGTQCAFCVNAHEGISIAESVSRGALILQKQFSLYASLMFLGAFGFIAWLGRPRFFLSNLAWFYGASFLLVSVIFLYPWVPLDSLRENVSLALHNFHSIFTLGSVILVDFLFIALRFNLRPYLQKIFPLITLGIWAGLGLDFINSGLIFNEAFHATGKVLFMQTLIGIVIINGVILSGPLARAIISFEQRMGANPLPMRLFNAIGISGSISLATWISITALDGFRTLTFGYLELLILYVLFIALLFLTRSIIVGVLTNIRIGV